jgi:hypothetical protein
MMTNLCRRCREEIYRPECKYCYSDNVYLSGQVINANNAIKQRYLCNDCNRTFRLPIDFAGGNKLSAQQSSLDRMLWVNILAAVC